MERNIGGIFNRLVKSAIPLVVVAGLGVYAVDRVVDNLVDIPDVNLDVPNPVSLEPEPAEIDVAIKPEFITVEETFDIDCKAQVTAAVGVRGFKNGPFGDGKVNKLIFGDFLVCSESVTGTAEVTQDAETGEAHYKMVGMLSARMGSGCLKRLERTNLLLSKIFHILRPSSRCHSLIPRHL
jgi:hypothetical protein